MADFGSGGRCEHSQRLSLSAGDACNGDDESPAARGQESVSLPHVVIR